jgi:iron complex transport system substrate-binding protein
MVVGMKIVSLLPSATEIVCALGLTEALVGVTHECDYPPDVIGKPVLTASRIHGRSLTGAEIDHAVSTRLGGHQGLYTLDEALLRVLQPDLVLTQELCDVCAVSYTAVQQAARFLDAATRVVSLEPTTLEAVLENIALVGQLTEREREAAELVTRLRRRLVAVRARVSTVSRRPRVWVCEWLDPPYSAGHWVSAQVDWAGGQEVFERLGLPSVQIRPEEVVRAAPDVIVLAPCGFHVELVEQEAARTAFFQGWHELPAVRAGAVWAVDASSYYSRPGPRLVDGVEHLARVLHPETVGAPDPATARRITASQDAPARA